MGSLISCISTNKALYKMRSRKSITHTNDGNDITAMEINPIPRQLLYRPQTLVYPHQD